MFICHAALQLESRGRGVPRCSRLWFVVKCTSQSNSSSSPGSGRVLACRVVSLREMLENQKIDNKSLTASLVQGTWMNLEPGGIEIRFELWRDTSLPTGLSHAKVRRSASNGSRFRNLLRNSSPNNSAN